MKNVYIAKCVGIRNGEMVQRSGNSKSTDGEMKEKWKRKQQKNEEKEK